MTRPYNEEQFEEYRLYRRTPDGEKLLLRTDDKQEIVNYANELGGWDGRFVRVANDAPPTINDWWAIGVRKGKRGKVLFKMQQLFDISIH